MTDNLNPVAVATSVMLLAGDHPAARYRLESAAALIASLDREFRQELTGRMMEAKREIVKEMLIRFA